MALTQTGTDGIKDDAITLAKQAAGTDGQIITYDASGNPVAVGPGTDGQVLTSTGAGSPPAFETLPTSGAALTGSTNNQITTVTGANAIQGEANLTFDGTTLNVGTGSGSTASAGYDEFVIQGGDADIGMNFLSPAANDKKQQISFGDSNNNQSGRIVYDHDGDHLTIGTNGTAERLRIDSNGDLGLGTTAVPQDSGARTLHIHDSTATERAHIRLTTGTSGTAADNGGFIGIDNNPDFYIYNQENGNLRFGTNGSERLRIQNAGGISFNGDSAAANALDDYEEGLYQPTVTASGSGSWSTNSYTYLAYTKIGRLVHVSGYININADNSANGDVRISLPFTAGNFTENADSGSLTVSLRGHNASADLYNVSGVVLAGVANFEIVSVRANGTHVWVGQEHCDASWNVRVGGAYYTV